LDTNKTQECLPELGDLEEAVTTRSSDLLKKTDREAPTGPVELPPMEGQQGEEAVFGIDFVLEVCKKSVPELPQEVRDDIERVACSTSEICMYEILSRLYPHLT